MQANRSRMLMMLAVVAACIAGYIATVNVGFLGDDFAIIYGIKHGTVKDLWGSHLYFRPLGLISFTLDWLVFGQTPLWYHLNNLALHAIASIGVAMIAEMTTRKTWAGLYAGVVFAIFPAHPEAVVWIAGRYDLLCGALLTWAFVCYLAYRQNLGLPRSRIFLTISLVLFAFACVSKEQAFIFPVTILILDLVYPTEDRAGASFLGRIKPALPFFAIALILFAIRFIVLRGIGGYVPENGQASIGATFLQNLTFRPLTTLLVPVNHSILSWVPPSWRFAFEMLFLCPFVLVRIRQWRFLGFCLGEIVVSMIPSAHLGLAGGALQNSRFLYTASIFFALSVGELLARDGKKRMAKPVALIGLFYCGLLFVTLVQNCYPWVEAGRITESVIKSADELTEKRIANWGVEIKELLIFNLPDDYVGAWIFQNGFPEMLRLRHAIALRDVEIVPLLSGVQSEENMKFSLSALGPSTIVWVYRDDERKFRESWFTPL